MKRIFTVLLASIVLISCGDDDPVVEEEIFFAQYEEQWLSTPSDKFGVEKGEGIYFYRFENGVVTHYVNNGRLNGIIYSWNYQISVIDDINFIELSNSPCWISNQGGFFQVEEPADGGDGFVLINPSTFSKHPFDFSEPNFPLEFDANPCAQLSNDWMDNYNGIVFTNERNDRFNRILFYNGVAYTLINKLEGYSKAFTYTTRADQQFEYFDIIDICVDYEEDFEMFRGEYVVNEFNNIDGLGNNGFIITRGIARLTYLYDEPGNLDELKEDCYITVF